MTDLTEFLRARLDEDEEAARYCSPAPWKASPRALYVDDAKGNRLAVLNFTEDGKHIARHDPARVLREVEARRVMLSRHGPIVRHQGWQPTCSFDNHRWPCADIMDLAAIYSDHPDYRQEWKP